eukprot:TRINITY_DN397_c0_g1_i7.p1 TRINITY_DN397_c0_g1~~TRINITY_DN397_c0_g1_i7.p1  ORF type:complete len:500 (+),score=154.88 TRINITY_DN397_c0_g1_i7:83-1582(+)
MMTFRAKEILFCILVALSYVTAYNIGVSPWDPMVACDVGEVETNLNDGIFSGYSVDIIHELTRKIGWARSQYNITCFEWDDMLQALEDGQLDFLISGISITSSDALRFSFTQPEYLSGLRILVRNEPGKAQASRPFAFFDPFELTLWLVFLGTTLVLANIYWFFELSVGKESEVHMKYLMGFLDGWFYVLGGLVGEDPFIEIRTYMSRVVQFTYKFMITILVATYTGSVAGIIAASQPDAGITGPAGLAGLTVATSDLQDNIDALQNYGANVKAYSWGTNENGYAIVQLLKDGKVDAVALDQPFIDYVAANDCSLKAVGTTFNLQNYGPAFRNGSSSTPLYDAVNLVMIDMQISGFFEALAAKHFPDSSCSNPDEIEKFTFLQMYGLWIILAGAVFLSFFMLGVGILYQRRKSENHGKSLWELFHIAGFAMSEAADEDEDDDESPGKAEADAGTDTEQAARNLAAEEKIVRSLENRVDRLHEMVSQLVATFPAGPRGEM